MKRAQILFIFPVLALVTGCTSTPPAPPVPPAEVVRKIPPQVQAPTGLNDQDFDAWLTAQRARVSDARSAAHRQYSEAEFACWRRFAVNDCLLDARKQRRGALDGLREEELALNLQERQRTTTARLKTLEGKQRAAEPKQ
ncbi:hypothetical protein FVQ98_02060 [Ottowia sp. GY511]|uniref:Lipoprotein n=1 Tax=Ottowia flava TaxID=2675430 RepID=A0ABW4KWM2_9BURK|nr:hypothetical protein [Ottowia sp. GY511]TXK33677.1 hypothetical protein FVQ98_02060 [Ottowia sp. GY511]